MRRWTISAGVIIVVAFAVRLAWLRAPHALQPDGVEYIQLARSLTTTGRYGMDGHTPSTFRPPLYPLLIAAVESATANWEPLLLGVQCLMGALTVGLTMTIARRFFSDRVALLAGAMLAVAPMTSQFAVLVLTETLFTFLVILAVFLWTSHRPISAGVAFGAAALTRASLLPYIFLVGVAGLFLVFLPGADRRAWRRIAAAALITIAPWVARNVVETGRWTVADAGWGVNLLVGTIDLRSGANRWPQIDAAIGADSGASSADTEKAALVHALEIIRTHPLHWLRVRARQWIWFFLDTGDYLPVPSNRITFRQALTERRPDTVLLKAGFTLGTAMFVCLAVYGAWTVRHRAAELSAIWTFPAYLAAAHLPMAIETRYGLPLVPFLAMFASVALVSATAFGLQSGAGGRVDIAPA